MAQQRGQTGPGGITDTGLFALTPRMRMPATAPTALSLGRVAILGAFYFAANHTAPVRCEGLA